MGPLIKRRIESIHCAFYCFVKVVLKGEMVPVF